MGASEDIGPQSYRDPFCELHSLLTGEDHLARLAAALWARVGRPLTIEDLGWIRDLTGDERAPQTLWEVLRAAGALVGTPLTLQAQPLSGVLGRLACGELAGPASSDAQEPEMVWTLPALMSDESIANTYREAAVRLISETQSRLLIVSPYIEARGVGLLFEELRRAMSRGVRIALITHAAGNLASINSRALEELRREAERVGGDLTVFSADPADSAGDRARQPLLHAKLLCADENRLLMGSANMTSYGLTVNLEAGIVLEGRPARQASAIVYKLLRSELVHKVFATRSDG